MVRYIHAKFSKPWLVKSFFLHRHSRDNMETSNTNSAVTISFSKTDSVLKRKLRRRSSINVDDSEKDSENSEVNEGNEPPTKKMKPINDIEDVNLVDFTTNVEDTTNSGSKKNDVSLVKNRQSNEMEIIDLTAETDKTIEENVLYNKNEGNYEDCSDNISQANKILEGNYSLKAIPHEENATQIKNEELKETTLSDFTVDKNKKILSSTSPESTATNNSTFKPENTIESPDKETETEKKHSRSLMKTTKRKWVPLQNENFNKFSNFDTS